MTAVDRREVRLAPAKRVLVVFGTRPEAIKMAPVVAALERHPRLSPMVAVTGQHQEMLRQVLDMFGVVADVDLALHTPGQTLEELTARALTGLAPVLREHAPDVVVVQGDTTTSFTAALGAFYAGVPVVHLEAGLRTGSLTDPFPEEANRRLISRLAALHLAATPANRASLEREGTDPATISVIGNTVIDAVLTASRWRRPWADPVLGAAIGDRRRGERPTVVVTAHRRESWGEPLIDIARAVADVAARRPRTQFLWPLHANPAVQRWVTPMVEACPNVVLTGPCRYDDFVRLLSIADAALTDSGGVQEEAPALGVPVLVTRRVTERQEAVDAGAARLVGTDRSAIVNELTTLLDDPAAHARMVVHGSPYGDGHAATRATHAIAALVGVGARTTEFAPRGVARPAEIVLA